MATWAIGDVHGCLDKLTRLWGKIAPRQEDEVVFLGDMIGRGPDSKGVLEFVLDRIGKGHQITCLMGNHEQMCLEWHSGNDESGYGTYWLINGGANVLESYGIPKNRLTRSSCSMPGDHLHFLSSFLPWYEKAETIFVHAGLRPGLPLEEQQPKDLYWIREDFFDHYKSFDRKIVYGHTPRPKVKRTGTLVGIDTGAVYGVVDPKYGTLTAYEAFEERFVQVT